MVSPARRRHMLVPLLVLSTSLSITMTTHAQLADPKDFHECIMASDKNDCAFSSLTNDTLIYPGGATRCAFKTRRFPKPTNATYRFQVQPGSDPAKKNHVLLFFQGGGGCTSEGQCRNLMGTNPLFSMNADPVRREGVFDDTKAENPFRGWTRVIVLYCTGDVHSGANTDLDAIQFNGRANVQSVLSWLQSNLPKPDQLVLSGCSAGALGVQLHAASIAARFPHVYTAVLPDSYPGFFPPRQGQILSRLWQSCAPAFGLEQEPALVAACHAGELGFVDLVSRVLALTPQIKYGYVNAKRDKVQELFYCIGNQQVPGCIRQPEYYHGVRDTLQTYVNTSADAHQVANFFLNAEGHCFLNKDKFYDMTSGTTALTHWIAQFILTPEELAAYPAHVPRRVIASVCHRPKAEAESEDKFDLTCDARLQDARVAWTETSLSSSGGGGVATHNNDNANNDNNDDNNDNASSHVASSSDLRWLVPLGWSLWCITAVGRARD